MASFTSLLSSNQPQFQTHQALIILGLQNDFVSPQGKLPVPTESGFLDRIKELVPKFRELAGDIIWVRSEFQCERAVNDGKENGDLVMMDAEENGGPARRTASVDEAATLSPPSKSSGRLKGKARKQAKELMKRLSSRKPSNADIAAEPEAEAPNEEQELFLSYTPKGGPCCQRGTSGADFADAVNGCRDPSDMVVVKSHYSAFNQTNLLTKLRAKLITELYICGCMTNLSVYATAVDAARHGITINLIEDCLGYRTQSRHEAAMKNMTIAMGAYTVESADIMWDLNHPPEAQAGESNGDGLQEAMGKMSLKDGAASENKTKPNSKSTNEKRLDELEQALANITLAKDPDTGRAIVVSAATDEDPTIGTFQRRVRQYASQPDLSKGYVKSRIRMRPRADKTKGVDSTPESPNTAASERPTTSSGSPSADRRKTKISADRKRHAREGKEVSREVHSSASPTAPPPESRTASTDTRTAPKKVHGNGVLNETAATTEKSTRASSRPRASRSSPSLRSQSKSPSHGSSPSPPVPEVPEIPPQHVSNIPASPSYNRKSSQPPATPHTTSTMGTKKQKGLPPNLSNLPTVGPGDTIGQGDSFVKHNLLSDEIKDPISGLPLSTSVFHALYHEVKWQKMYHVGGEVPRLVAIQGSVNPTDGSKPVYRHPSDQSPPLLPFSPTVDLVRKQAEKVVGHELNHVLIQLYRSGEDYISEHSDKTLDIVHGSSIVNASFGAKRTMRLRTKKASKSNTPAGTPSKEDGPATPPNAQEQEKEERVTQRIALPHNSIFVLGAESNAHLLHGIQPDKRMPSDKSAEELAYNGMRISLTFRHIGTFLSADEKLIWGQGAKGKTREKAGKVLAGDKEETKRMIRAFGRENHDIGRYWSEWYGDGFDVLHFVESTKDAE
jgi:nicotinamidase-related amidase/alkylated DNA repair dioxygenase AlkB